MAGVTVRELITKLTLGGDGEARLAKFGLAVNGVKAGLGLLKGAFDVVSGASLGLADSVSKAAVASLDASRGAGVGVVEFQKLEYAAKRTGVPFGSMARGLRFINKSIKETGDAAKKGQLTGFASALGDVGLRLKDLDGLSATDKFGLISEALQQVKGDSDRAAISAKLFGEESGPQLAGFLLEGRKGIKALGKEAEDLGIIMSADAVSASEDYQNTLIKLEAAVTGVKQTIGVGIIPVLNTAVNSFKDWIKVNRELIAQRVGHVIDGLVNAFSSLLGKGDRVFAMFDDGLKVIIKLVGFIGDTIEMFGGLENSIRVAAAAWVTYSIAQTAALGPIGLAVAAATALAVAFMNVETNADRARMAQERLGKSKNEDIDVDKKRAAFDAKQLSFALRKGKDPSRMDIRKLVSSSAIQAEETLKRTGDILRGLTDAQGNLRQAGKSGIMAQRQSDPRALRILEALKAEVVHERAMARRDIEAEERRLANRETTESYLAGLGSDPRKFNPISAGSGAAKKDKQSLEDLISEAIKSGKLPEEAALLASTQPPIIITQQRVDVQMDVSVNAPVTGVPGESAELLGVRMVDIVRDQLQIQFRGAIDQLRPRLAK